MRVRCPSCNSIQTKMMSKFTFETLGGTHKCKNCGNRFFLNEVKTQEVAKKSKGFFSGCFGLLIKVFIFIICISVLLAIFMKDDEPKKNVTEKEGFLTEKLLDIDSKGETEKKSVSSESIKDSDNPEDTLNIKTTIREKE